MRFDYFTSGGGDLAAVVFGLVIVTTPLHISGIPHQFGTVKGFGVAHISEVAVHCLRSKTRLWCCFRDGTAAGLEQKAVRKGDQNSRNLFHSITLDQAGSARVTAPVCAVAQINPDPASWSAAGAN